MSVASRRRAAVVASGLLVSTVLAGCGGDAPSVDQQTQASSTSAATESSSSSSSGPAPTQSTASSPASTSVAGERSNRVKMCDASDADTTRKVCKTNSADISSNIIYCSADLPSSIRGSVRATLYRNGATVYEGSINRTTSVGSLFLNFSVGELKLPGGDYTCKFMAGEDTWVGTAKVAGPNSRASQGMACDAATMYSREAVTHCTKNSPTLDDPSSLGCSALITDLMGRKVDGTLYTPDGGSKDVALAASFTSGAAVVHLKAPKTAFGGNFPKGDYRCEFKVDDQPVVNIPFSVK